MAESTLRRERSLTFAAIQLLGDLIAPELGLQLGAAAKVLDVQFAVDLAVERVEFTVSELPQVVRESIGRMDFAIKTHKSFVLLLASFGCRPVSQGSIAALDRKPDRPGVFSLTAEGFWMLPLQMTAGPAPERSDGRMAVKFNEIGRSTTLGCGARGSESWCLKIHGVSCLTLRVALLQQLTEGPNITERLIEGLFQPLSAHGTSRNPIQDQKALITSQGGTLGVMVAVILGWNPDKGHWSGNYRAAMAKVRDDGRCFERWSRVGMTRLAAGTEIWLLVQETRPNRCGLIGHGTIIGESFLAAQSTAGAADASQYVEIEFDLLLPEGEQLRTDDLEARMPGVDWSVAPPSGIELPPEAEQTLRALWAEYVPNSTAEKVGSLAPVPGSYPERSLRRVSVNRHEADGAAASVAIAHHGSSCHACGFDFEATYGPEGAALIHVHHAVPPSQLTGDYEIDPISDLVPLCPNCHHMAHQRHPTPYTVADLRAMIAAAGHMPGEIVTQGQLEAQEDARRLMGN